MICSVGVDRFHSSLRHDSRMAAGRQILHPSRPLNRRLDGIHSLYFLSFLFFMFFTPLVASLAIPQDTPDTPDSPDIPGSSADESADQLNGSIDEGVFWGLPYSTEEISVAPTTTIPPQTTIITQDTISVAPTTTIPPQTTIITQAPKPTSRTKTTKYNEPAYGVPSITTSERRTTASSTKKSSKSSTTSATTTKQTKSSLTTSKTTKAVADSVTEAASSTPISVGDSLPPLMFTTMPNGEKRPINTASANEDIDVAVEKGNKTGLAVGLVLLFLILIAIGLGFYIMYKKWQDRGGEAAAPGTSSGVNGYFAFLAGYIRRTPKSTTNTEKVVPLSPRQNPQIQLQSASKARRTTVTIASCLQATRSHIIKISQKLTTGGKRRPPVQELEGSPIISQQQQHFQSPAHQERELPAEPVERHVEYSLAPVNKEQFATVQTARAAQRPINKPRTIEVRRSAPFIAAPNPGSPNRSSMDDLIARFGIPTTPNVSRSLSSRRKSTASSVSRKSLRSSSLGPTSSRLAGVARSKTQKSGKSFATQSSSWDDDDDDSSYWRQSTSTLASYYQKERQEMV
ncbi:hypothetical protein EDC01DRAFT_726864 [Geopyxis carbonaria]|nr:hypothetical protein EDC01DRAFT_726864 [Geopyxis carbonaria]